LGCISAGPRYDRFWREAVVRGLGRFGGRKLDLFEIAPNCRNLSDRSAIFQNECGHDASRIDRDVGIGVLLANGEIERYKRDSDAFLSQEDPNPP